MDGYPVNILNDTSNVSLTNPLPIRLPPTASDAFGRSRVSQPFTIFDNFHRYAEDTKMVTYTSNTAYSNFDMNGASMVLTVGSNQGDRIYRESTRVFAYQPGKSLQVLKTFCMSPPKTGLRQRQGYFDTSNGFYLQMDGSNVSFVKRSMATGTLHETIVLQDSWNYDPMKGNGPSRYTLDLTRVQIFFLDIEWLGVGSSRMGFVIDGKFNICHIFNHANQPSTPTNNTTYPYMTTACLPMRIEVENTAPTGSMSSFRSICTSIISEGGYELRGRNYSIGISSLTSPVQMPLADTFYCIIGIRLKSTRPGAIVIPTDVSILPISSGNYRWAIIRNATIANPVWTGVNDVSSVEYTLDGGTLTGGTIMKSGYVPATNQASSAITLQGTNFKFQLERDSFTSTSYTFIIALASDAAGHTAVGSIDWEEITI